MAKEITIIFTHSDRETSWTGTIQDLSDRVFGYTLECGHSWNSRIPRWPKTARSLVKALNDSAYACHRYNDFYSLA